MKNLEFAKSCISEFIAEKGLPETAASDMELSLADVLHADDGPANIRELDNWLAARPHLHSQDRRQSFINISAERMAFGSGATLLARSHLLKQYGPKPYAERMSAWGASPGSLTAGTEPGAVAMLGKNGQADLERSNSPFNPAKSYKTPEARQADIAKYILQFGPTSAAKATQRFHVDLAGRPIQRRVF
jgi:hypothetical protein